MSNLHFSGSLAIMSLRIAGKARSIDRKSSQFVNLTLGRTARRLSVFAENRNKYLSRLAKNEKNT